MTATNTGKRFPPELEQKIIEAQRKGHSYRDMAEMFHVSMSGISAVLKRSRTEPIGQMGKQLINLDNLESRVMNDVKTQLSREDTLNDIWDKIFSYEWDFNDLPEVWSIAENLRKLETVTK